MTNQQAAKAEPSLPAHVRDALARFPRAEVLTWPTPLEPLRRLSEHVGADLRVKRDDLTGMALGSNKVRKLEYYFGKALAQGADTVLITGAVQSNYVRVAAAFAARFGLDCHIQLEERVAGADSMYRTNGNVLLDDLLGATRSTFPVGEDETAADAEVARIAERLKKEGKTPFIVPLSPGNAPLGSLGYVRAAEELLKQCPDMAALVVASGSGLTHTGLLFGLRAMGWAGNVHGVCVRRSSDLQRPRIEGHAQRLSALLDVKNPVVRDDILADDTLLPPGYGKLNDAIKAAVTAAARLEGLVLDPVYTGRTFAAATKLAAAGALPASGPTVIVHTGGIPALFAYENEIRDFI